MSQELTNTGERLPATGPADMLAAIQRAAADPTCNVEKMQALLAMAVQMQEITARNEFHAALARVQANMPRISRDGEIVIRGAVQSRYAKLESIAKIIRPLLAEEGFAISFDTRMDEGKFVVIGKLTHGAGHSETKEIPLALDTSGNKSGTQASGSTFSYGQRYLIKMFFNIVEDGSDVDGQPPLEPITTDQAIVIRDLIAESHTIEKRLLDWVGVQRIEDIPRSRYAEIVAGMRKKVAK